MIATGTARVRLLLSAAVLPGLLALLTFSLLRGLNPAAPTLDRATAAIDAFMAADRGLFRTILSARAGLLRNYDPVVQQVAALEHALTRLHATGVAGATTDRLAQLLDEQEDLTEEFKSDNALLQNSLSYFTTLSEKLSGPDVGRAQADAVSRVAAAMLQLSLDTSPARAEQFGHLLDVLAAGPHTADDRAIDGLVTHGRLLRQVLPRTDAVVRTMLALPHDQVEAAVVAEILARRHMARLSAERYRALLYVTGLALCALLAYLGVQLRRRIVLQQRRAAFEHLIGTISLRFMAATRDLLRTEAQQTLKELANWLQADRAYFAVPDDPECRPSWVRSGAEFPAGWPAGALQLADFTSAARKDVLLQDVSRLPSDRVRDRLTMAGVHSWACISGPGPNGMKCLLGFDTVRAPLRLNPEEVPLLHMAFDLLANASGRNRLEHEQARLQTKVQQAHRLQTVAVLTGGVTHNFNNIIGSILGYVEMAETRSTHDAQLADHLAGIRASGERARMLVEQILDFGRRREGGRRPVDLRSLTAETLAHLRAALPAAILMQGNDVPPGAAVAGDAVQLQQVIINLCRNAADAMDGSGTVSLRITAEELAVPRVLSHGRLDAGPYVRIAVQDTGKGIDARNFRLLFEPFFTTRSTGNGLGLATVREVVHEHGGALNVLSSPGAGSVFEVWLPRLQAENEPAAGADSQFLFGAGETVLVLNSDAGRLLHDEELVAAIGYEPVGFARLDDAIAACAATPDRFDAFVIAGFEEPVSNEALVALKRHKPGAPVLLATMVCDNDLAAAASLGLEVAEIVRYPLDAPELAAALSRHFGSVQEGGLAGGWTRTAYGSMNASSPSL